MSSGGGSSRGTNGRGKGREVKKKVEGPYQKSTQPGTSIVHIHTERNLKPANGAQTSFFPFFFFFCHTTQSGTNDYLWDKSIGNNPFGVTTNLCDFFFVF